MRVAQGSSGSATPHNAAYGASKAALVQLKVQFSHCSPPPPSRRSRMRKQSPAHSCRVEERIQQQRAVIPGEKDGVMGGWSKGMGVPCVHAIPISIIAVAPELTVLCFCCKSSHSCNAQEDYMQIVRDRISRFKAASIV